MKPTMLYAIVLLVSIILMTAFDISLSPTVSVAVSDSVAPNALYVCPAASTTWDTLSRGFSQFTRPLIIGFLFAAMLLIFSWAWALYQNLLKDKFVRDAFKQPWAFTKLFFWAIVAVYILVMTPNYFRGVRLDGASGEWVLCDSDSPGRRVVRAESVHPGN